ncbi:rod shape-determining protein MreC [Microaerobacter geothermalis]|uniref:rod shape-determining protein MreC n=1 Tax=Microaerobacter geothermalis TaxID=674972 RepID=UPI001F34A363|nr:rod shape-determining protein MreC [Microaerobacter geothermalis]
MNKRLVILLFSLITLVIFVGITLGLREKTTLPEKMLLDTTSIFQRIFYKPASSIAGLFQNVKDMYSIYEENKVLKSNLEKFAQVSAELNRLKDENQRLREMLDAKESMSDYKLLVAEVIARSPDRWNNVIIIDKGSKNGIKKDMAVLSPKGLIGSVQRVANFSSSVQLLTDVERGSQISVVVQGDQSVFGIIEGYIFEEGLLVMRKVPIESPLKPGQMVVTSGLGGVFPPGLLVGEVTQVVTGDYGLTQMAYVKPAADFYRLNEVFVVERSFVVPSDQGVQP